MSEWTRGELKDQQEIERLEPDELLAYIQWRETQLPGSSSLDGKPPAEPDGLLRQEEMAEELPEGELPLEDADIPPSLRSDPEPEPVVETPVVETPPAEPPPDARDAQIAALLEQNRQLMERFGALETRLAQKPAEKAPEISAAEKKPVEVPRVPLPQVGEAPYKDKDSYYEEFTEDPLAATGKVAAHQVATQLAPFGPLIEKLQTLDVDRLMQVVAFVTNPDIQGAINAVASQRFFQGVARERPDFQIEEFANPDSAYRKTYDQTYAEINPVYGLDDLIAQGKSKAAVAIVLDRMAAKGGSNGNSPRKPEDPPAASKPAARPVAPTAKDVTAAANLGAQLGIKAAQEQSRLHSGSRTIPGGGKTGTPAKPKKQPDANSSMEELDAWYKENREGLSRTSINILGK